MTAFSLSLALIFFVLWIRERMLRVRMVRPLDIEDWEDVKSSLDDVLSALRDYDQVGRLLDFFRGSAGGGFLVGAASDGVHTTGTFSLTWTNADGQTEKREIRDLEKNRSAYESLALRQQRQAKIQVISAVERIREM